MACLAARRAATTTTSLAAGVPRFSARASPATTLHVLTGASTTTTTPLAAGAYIRRSAATTTPLPAGASRLASAVTTQHLLTGAATTTPLATGAASTTPLAAGAYIPRSAATTTPLHAGASSLASAVTTQHLLTGAATTTPLATGAATTTSTPLAILGHRAVRLPHAAAFSSSTSTYLLGSRSTLSSPAWSMLARRGMATIAPQALTPELQSALKQIDEASAARHEELMKELETFEIYLMDKYSAATVASSETALTAGKVAWRVGSAVLAFGVTTLIAVLQTVKEGWKLEYHAEVKVMLQTLIHKLKADLLLELREIVRSEMLLVEAEKAAAKK